MTEDAKPDVGIRIEQIADELRAHAADGLRFSHDPYDLDRFRRTQVLAAELSDLVNGRSSVEIGRIFQEDLLGPPSVAVDAAIVDADSRLLVAQRADSGEWCMPGGASDVGESPSAGAVREAREETGLVVRATRVIGVFDNRTFGLPSIARHLYFLVFKCEVVSGVLTPSIETTDFRWVTEEEALALPLFRSHNGTIPEAFRLHRTPGAPPAFH